MDSCTTSQRPIAAPAASAWLLLSSPQSWTGLAGAFTVDFAGRRGDGTWERARYRLTTPEASAEVTVATDARDRVATLTPDDAEAPALRWRVDEADDGTGILRWQVTGELPAAVDSVWRAVADADTALVRWAAVMTRMRAIADAGDPAAVARALAPFLRDRAEHSAAAATLDAGCVAAIRAGGLFRLGAPDVLGGRDYDFRTVVDTVAELSAADAAAGWCTFIGNQSAYLAWFDEPVAKEFAGGDGGVILAGSTAISGQAEPSGTDTYRVSGRWRFNSGCLHADWLMGGVTVPTEGGAEPMLAVVPRRSAEIVDTWHVAGLAGTGSHDLVLTDCEVPARRFAPLFSATARCGGRLHRLSPYNIQGVLMIGLPLGIARRALDEIAALAGNAPLLDDVDVAAELARLETDLAAARALALHTVDDYCERFGDDANPPSRDDPRLALALRHVTDTAKRIVGEANLLGAHAANPALERCQRDIVAAGQHLAVSDDVVRRNAVRFIGGDRP